MTELRIKNWAQFQHYKKRNPPWIKLHFSILSSADWVMLDDASRLLAVVCMLIASKHDGNIPASASAAYFKRIAYLDHTPNFKPLIDSGFLMETLADASTVLASARPEQRQRHNKIASHKKNGRGRATPLPLEWHVPQRATEIARELAVDVRATEGQFRDYLKSTGKQYIDYDAAFCNFVRNAPRFSKGNRPLSDQERRAQRTRDTGIV
jgi:hypothetical protein